MRSLSPCENINSTHLSTSSVESLSSTFSMTLLLQFPLLPPVTVSPSPLYYYLRTNFFDSSLLKDTSWTPTTLSRYITNSCYSLQQNYWLSLSMVSCSSPLLSFSQSNLFPPYPLEMSPMTFFRVSNLKALVCSLSSIQYS